MKYIIRSGKVRGEGAYWCGGRCWLPPRQLAKRFDTLKEARDEAEQLDAVWDRPSERGNRRIVRLLSHEEAKRKAKAEVLREVAGDAFGLHATDLRTKADELWPVKGKR